MNEPNLSPEAGSPSTTAKKGWPVAGICAVLAAMTLAVFGQTLRHDFVNFDDDVYVYANPMVARGLSSEGIVWAFTRVHASNWHPLTWISHMLDCQIYGLHPGGHHLTSVLIHIATVIALFLVLRQMTGAFWRSAFVAAVFAIHPLRVESVAWVAERKVVLSGFFFMLTVGAYVRYARRPWSVFGYGLVVLLFVMGLMCKPMLVTVPLVLLLLDYWPLKRQVPLVRLVLEKLPLLGLSAFVAAGTMMAQKAPIQSGGLFPLPLRLANACVACRVYLDQMVYPAGLAVLYPLSHVLPASEAAMAVFLLACFSVFAWRERRKQPWVLTGWLWYLVMLLPVVGIIQVGDQAHADRYTYLPQIGIYVALTWLAAELKPGRAVAGVLMAGILAVLMFCAWKQTGYWQDSISLWSRAVACTKNNSTAYNNLGNALCQQGRMDEGIENFELALQINPRDQGAHNNLGNGLLQKGRIDEAIDQFQQALQIQPAYAEAFTDLGNALIQKGKVDDAIDQYLQALQIRPNFATAHNNLGNALLQKGRTDEAINQYQQALQLNPGSAEILMNLQKALQQRPGPAASATH